MADPLSSEFDTDALLRTAVPPSRVPPMTEEETERQQAGINPLAHLAREYFMPAQMMRNPNTPEARAAYTEAMARAHAAGGGKVPPIPGSEMFTPGQGMTMDLLSNVGPKALAALKVLSPAAKAIGAIHAGDPLSPPMAPIGEGERAISAALDRMATRRGRTEWVTVPEGGQGIYMRVRPNGIDVANVSFEKTGTGAFSRYLDHIETEAAQRGLRDVTVENIFNKRLIPFLQKRGFELRSGEPPSMIKRIVPIDPKTGGIDIARYYGR